MSRETKSISKNTKEEQLQCRNTRLPNEEGTSSAIKDEKLCNRHDTLVGQDDNKESIETVYNGDDAMRKDKSKENDVKNQKKIVKQRELQ